MNRRFSQGVLAACTTLGALRPALTFAAAPTVVPLQATIEIMEQIVAPEEAYCFMTGKVSGASTVSSLGPLTLASSDCINPVTQTSFVFVSDDVVLTTAGGDQIWAAYGGTLSATTGQIQGTYLIFGGTGRYKRAKGVGTISGLEDISAGAGQIQLKGTLSY
jgi:hypothetical protein